MKYKVAELEGVRLDAAVAKAEGHDLRGRGFKLEGGGSYGPARFILGGVGEYAPSQDWQFGGPIIERERMALMLDDFGRWVAGWQTSSDAEEVPDDFRRVAGECWRLGPTPLIAAMRSYVASKFDDEVELP